MLAFIKLNVDGIFGLVWGGYLSSSVFIFSGLFEVLVVGSLSSDFGSGRLFILDFGFFMI